MAVIYCYLERDNDKVLKSDVNASSHFETLQQRRASKFRNWLFHDSSLSYRNQCTDLLCKSMNWFLYDSDLHHERVK